MHRHSRIPAFLVTLLASLFVSCLSPGLRFNIAFPAAVSLKKGSEVRYLGVQVGHVRGVSVRTQSSATPAHVIVNVEITYKGIQLRQSDGFRVATAGLLGGEYIDVTPGSPQAPPIEEEATVQGVPREEVNLSQFKAALELMALGRMLEGLPEHRRHGLLTKFREMLQEAAKTEQTTGHPPSDKPHDVRTNSLK